MSKPGSWRDLFGVWPSEIPHRGVLVTSFGEQIAFSSFSIGDGFLLVERQTPDAVGARALMLPYDQILGVKITDVVKPRLFQAFGFDVSAGQK
jgi:hypothetical protein